MIEIECKPCIMCGKRNKVFVPREGFENWQRGMFIQDALPMLSAAEREMLISGTCSGCFDTLFPEDD